MTMRVECSRCGAECAATSRFCSRCGAERGAAAAVPGAARVLRCPRCDAALTVSTRSGVEIDHCSSCRGVWLDRGELDKLVAREFNRDDDDRRERDWDDERYDGRSGDSQTAHKRRRKSFWTELFDFD